MQRVPKPGASIKACSSCCMVGSAGASSLGRPGSISVWKGLSECVVGGAYLIKVTWSSYIQGCSSRLGYFPNGGTIRLKTSAMQTKTAGSTICRWT